MTAAQARLTICEQVSWTSRLAATFGWPTRKRVLDPRTLSDHLKRDMGLLDGNDPCGRRR